MRINIYKEEKKTDLIRELSRKIRTDTTTILQYNLCLIVVYFFCLNTA